MAVVLVVYKAPPLVYDVNPVPPALVGKVPVVKAEVLVAYIALPLLKEAMPVPP
jgi:hypothetical protein